MADQTKIEWTDSTFNPWIGCTKISAGCDHCYAERQDQRFNKGIHWGAKSTPKCLSDNYWKRPLHWNSQAADFFQKHGRSQLVFCGSMCYVFDNNAPKAQRERLWELIRSTPQLNWQLLTKRPENAERFLPTDWGEGYPNVWLGVSVENQDVLHRVDKLQRIPAVIRFLSVEPLIEHIQFFDMTNIDWVIVGGETGSGARSMCSNWAQTIQFCAWAHSAAFFFKQWGDKPKIRCNKIRLEKQAWPTKYLTGDLSCCA